MRNFCFGRPQVYTPNNSLKIVRFPLALLNKLMRNYTAHDITKFFTTYEQHISHILVAHTIYHPFGKSNAEIGRMSELARRDLRHAMNHFGRLLHPNAPNRARRNPYRYAPLVLVTMEGARETTDRGLTIHFNISLGNLPKVLDTQDIHTLFMHAWHDKAHQSDDVKAYDYTANQKHTWHGYGVKEAQQKPKLAWTTDGVWDVQNCWIPHAALIAD